MINPTLSSRSFSFSVIMCTLINLNFTDIFFWRAPVFCVRHFFGGGLGYVYPYLFRSYFRTTIIVTMPRKKYSIVQKLSMVRTLEELTLNDADGASLRAVARELGVDA